MRPGEKINECLIADFECKDSIDLGENYLIRPHSNIGVNNERGLKKSFTSDETKILKNEEISALLRRVNAIE